jgi:hypothetical protein
VNGEFFMDEDAEEPQHFFAVGARDRVSDDLLNLTKVTYMDNFAQII